MSKIVGYFSSHLLFFKAFFVMVGMRRSFMLYKEMFSLSMSLIEKSLVSFLSLDLL